MAKLKGDKTTSEGAQKHGSGGLASHVGSIIRFPQLVEAVRAEREPSDQVFRFIILAMQHPDARDKGLIALLSQVDAWLRSKVSLPECHKHFVQVGMPQALAGLLQRHGVLREDVAEEACAVVGSAALQSKEIALALVQASVLELICDCMTQHIESSGVQQSGVGAICALAQHGLIRSKRGAKAQLIGSGVAARCVLQAMVSYPQLENLQFFGCEGLRHLVKAGESLDPAFVEASKKAAEVHAKARAVVKASRELLQVLEPPEKTSLVLMGVDAVVNVRSHPPPAKAMTDLEHRSFEVQSAGFEDWRRHLP
eukprot:gnl/MRDRNA2_/MRDRNA2_28514_c0_seq1.p1 gnl/MRDRNA2_/MRDRNA2_28514_c0~~gnl/MRDRNA2_/MRDRNA2_28514_c0_seq1.p1  ORF type:complete len:311 (-),score=67.57 gnl/MRDRNA2_/MRDRNA2_28514_c0_seq1:111-1043(-)